MLDEKMKVRLCEAAKTAAGQAYCPYSRFRVGAAILGKSGKIYTGCNVENASYGLTICAERNAATTMVAGGDREFLALAVYAGRTGGDAAPCGACRQFLLEFAAPDLQTPVFLTGEDGGIRTVSMRELCPYPFRSFVPSDPDGA